MENPNNQTQPQGQFPHVHYVIGLLFESWNTDTGYLIHHPVADDILGEGWGINIVIKEVMNRKYDNDYISVHTYKINATLSPMYSFYQRVAPAYMLYSMQHGVTYV